MGQRVIIVDFNHIAYAYSHSSFRLSERVLINGKLEEVDTTIQTGAIKCINRWANRGTNPIAVCFDSPVPGRKCYYAKAFDMGVDTDQEYKGGRSKMSNLLFDSITMSESLLRKGGVACFRAHNYEADDLIYACVKAAKRDYPGLPIDIITNDADIVPLVDDTVSVFLRSKKNTWAEDKSIEKAHYIQIRPYNYQEVMQGLSAFNKFLMPYNTVLLHKLLRGDSADNINGIKKLFPPKKYNAMIEAMIADGLDIGNIFRYGDCIKHYCMRSTRTEVNEEYALAHKSDCLVKFDNPVEYYNILSVIEKYAEFTGEVERVKDFVGKMYLGMNLNQAYTGIGNISRAPASITKPIPGYNFNSLKEACFADLRIRLD